MVTENLFGPLFTTVASRLSEHPGNIAQLVAATLTASTQLPIVKPPQLVPQCDALSRVLSEPTESLLLEINKIADQLHWSDSSGGIKSEDVRHLLAFVELLGPTGMVVTPNCRAGLYLQLAHTHYPAHRHAAEELYLPLSGTGKWYRDSAPNGILQSPGDIITHKSFESHTMQAFDDPLLAFWCWRGNLDFNSYEMV